MKFRISAASGKIPEESYPGKYPILDIRHVDDPKKLRMGEEAWYAAGTNHRVEDGCIVRDMGTEDVHFIDIYTLARLKFLVKKYGSIIVDGDELVIYDDYLE